MTTSREDSVYLAKLAEQAERYEGELGRWQRSEALPMDGCVVLGC